MFEQDLDDIPYLGHQIMNLDTQKLYQLQYSFSALGSTSLTTVVTAKFGADIIGESEFVYNPGNSFTYKKATHLFQPTSSDSFISFSAASPNTVAPVQVAFDDFSISEWVSPCIAAANPPTQLCGDTEGLEYGILQEGKPLFDTCIQGCVEDPNCLTLSWSPPAKGGLFGSCYYSSDRQQDLVLPREDGLPNSIFYDRDCFQCGEVAPVCAE